MDLHTADIYDLIRPHIRHTPLLYSWYYSSLVWANVYLKCENLQYTNSFKVRWAFATLLQIPEHQRKYTKIVTTSWGNHGIAVAYAAQKCWIPVTVYVTETTSQYKKDKIMRYGAHVETFAWPRHIANEEVMRNAEKSWDLYIHPFAQESVIAGQSTLWYEIMQDLTKTTKIICSIGGGWLISWVASWFKAIASDVHVYGVETLWADSMYQALAAWEPVTLTSITSICDSLWATKVAELTLGIVKEKVSSCSTVTDAEALEDVRTILREEKLLIEPASACCLSALRVGSITNITPTDTIVAVLCWGNISNEQLKARL